MKKSLSLRARLTIVILSPLILIAVLVGLWAYADAQKNAAERFDLSLLSTALAVSRDIALTGGDALSEETRDLLRDTSGGGVFYHAYAPDGVFVTGYATPPVPPSETALDAVQVFYDANYQGAPVRALRVSQSTSIDGLTGLFTFTVWQETSVRDGFVRSRTGPVFLVIASMITALAFIVWFGVERGLAPLIDLEDAIAQRSAGDLSPIKRRIPAEVTGIVGRFNSLLSDLSRTLAAKDAFISDAAHQLRNPIAGVLSLAESVHSAKSLEDAKTRSEDLREAARDAGQLANNLLMLDKAQGPAAGTKLQVFDPVAVLRDVAAKFRASTAGRGLNFEADLPEGSVQLSGDPVMFEQAVLNLLTNAELHGGANLTAIILKASISSQSIHVAVSDDGIGIASEHFDRALSRFSQIGPSAGSGLGLPIAKAVAESYGGQLVLSQLEGRFSVSMRLPVASCGAAV